VGSDPGGTGSDIASTSPARSSRSGQAYGRSGRARIRGTEDSRGSSATASLDENEGRPAKRGKTIRPIRAVAHEDEAVDGTQPLPDPDSEAELADEGSRSLPVTSDDPSIDAGTRRIPD
jgi:hypothetical protein